MKLATTARSFRTIRVAVLSNFLLALTIAALLTPSSAFADGDGKAKSQPTLIGNHAVTSMAGAVLSANASDCDICGDSGQILELWLRYDTDETATYRFELTTPKNKVNDPLFEGTLSKGAVVYLHNPNTDQHGVEGTIGNEITIYKEVVGADDLVVGTVHTSCSQTINLGDDVGDNGYSFIVVAGTSKSSAATCSIGASIGDTVFNDTNGNGVQETGEPGIGGITVNLKNDLGTVIATTSTDSNGQYDFTGLNPGTYTVDVDEDGLDTGLILTTGNEPLTVTVNAGDDYNQADFGYWCPTDLLWEEDYDGTALTSGQVIDDEFAAYGIHVTTSDPVNHPAMIFNSACGHAGEPACTGDDSDLMTPGDGDGNYFELGNVLIVSEDGDSSDPDDKGDGGTLIFTFDQPVSVNGVTLLDIENDATVVKTYTTANGSDIPEVFEAESKGNNSAQTLSTTRLELVRRVEVVFDESGALGGLFFCGEVVLPVELTSFDAMMDGRDALLRWETASETNNAGFEIQHRYVGTDSPAKAGTFETLAWVDGNGTTEAPQAYSFRSTGLEPGRHVFRLKQIDFDGTFEYSPEVEIAVEMPQTFIIDPIYPNPFNPEATLRFGVRQTQEVHVEMFNVLGQRVLQLFRGVVEADMMQTVRIDGSTLRSGTYLVRIQGERFSSTQQITLVK